MLLQRSRELTAGFDRAHAEATMALEIGDYDALEVAIERARAIAEEHALLIGAPGLKFRSK